MNIDTMSMAVSLLVSEGIHATVEYPGCIHVIRNTSNYVFGTVNPTFDADVFNLPDAFADGGDPDHSIQTDILSTCDDAVLVAQTIAQIVSPEQPHSFVCAYCRNILNPGDAVVFHQDSETNIDVFCSDACKYEENPATALEVIKAVAETYTYFTNKLGEAPRDQTLRELDLETPCGQSCKTAIDSAVTFLSAVDSSLRDDIVRLANDAVEIFWRG